MSILYKFTLTREYSFAIFLAASFSMAIVYTNVMTYDPVITPKTGYSDTIDYIAVYRGEAANNIRAFRPLTPLLARLVPDFPKSIFDVGRSITDDFQIALKFGAINVLFLVGASLTIFRLQQSFELDGEASLIGMLLFLASPVVVRSAGLPMTDTAFYFFFSLLLFLILEKRYIWIVVVSILGALTKELVLLAIPLIWIMPKSIKERLGLTAAMIPAVIAYLLLRILLPLTPLASGYSDSVFSGENMSLFGEYIAKLLTIEGLIDIFMSFGFAGPLAFYGFLKADLPKILSRWCWLVVIVFMGVFLGGGNLARSPFTAFPVVMPLAAMGMLSISNKIKKN